MAEGCIFCSIAAGKLPSPILYQDDRVIVINDINPRAPVHQLVIPREHIASLNEVGLVPGGQELLGHIMQVANRQAKKMGVAEKGYRLVINCGLEGGQAVPHLHLHLLGGRRLSNEIG